MWYDAMAVAPDGTSHRALCHAESEDGVHWDKRETGLIAFGGSSRNNIVAPSRMAGASVFRDDQAPAAERYKLWTKYYASEEDRKQGIRTGLWAMVSPDGFRWKRADERVSAVEGERRRHPEHLFPGRRPGEVRRLRAHQETAGGKTADLLGRRHVLRRFPHLDDGQGGIQG